MHCGRHNSFSKISTFWSYESEQCKDIPGLGIATWPSLNLSERQTISSKHYENYYRWQKMWNGQNIKISVNGALMIFGLVCMVIE